MTRVQIVAASAALAVGIIGAATDGVGAANPPLFTVTATRSCLTALPNSVAGLPPTTPPEPPRLFTYALALDDISTWGVGQPRPRAHRQLGVWYGDRKYQGIILSFFESASDARASLKPLAWLYGGKLARNVVLTWDQKPGPGEHLRDTVLGCLRSVVAGDHSARRPPPKATLATYAGRWGGHTRGLAITSTGKGGESTDDGCCTHVYDLSFQILSVNGTLVRATAIYRVTAFKRYEAGTRMLRVGEIGKLALKDGIVTNTLTGDIFCSDPAWGATGACGA